MPARLLVLAFLVGCSSATRAPAASSDVLTRDEILASAATTAYDAIAQLRPHFFHNRGARTLSTAARVLPVVYVNDVRHGGMDVLRTIQVAEIDEIRYLNAADATTRHGTGHTGGVIEVRTYIPRESQETHGTHDRLAIRGIDP